MRPGQLGRFRFLRVMITELVVSTLRAWAMVQFAIPDLFALHTKKIKAGGGGERKREVLRNSSPKGFQSPLMVFAMLSSTCAARSMSSTAIVMTRIVQASNNLLNPLASGIVMGG